jgi:hypothetical protein
MTGRAAGYCAGYGVPGYANAVPGRGFGWRGRLRGRGGGFRHGFHATGLPGWARFGAAGGFPAVPMTPALGAAPVEEVAVLREQAEYLAEALEEVRARLEELRSSDEERPEG